ncbi:MAG: hypothetical protein JWN03_4986 [Nocardia sp.]|nr:hypothetical protein [Nocardia sp.]
MTISLRAWTGEFHDVPWTEVADRLQVCPPTDQHYRGRRENT